VDLRFAICSLRLEKTPRQAVRSGSARFNRKSQIQNRKSTAFTLTEILVVIALIVLLLVLAVPAFNLITGGKSIEGATNQLSAALGRARAQAIGLQQPTGVMFFIEPRSGRRVMGIVTKADAPAATVGAATQVEVWLDLADADFIPLPAGVSAQTMCDATFAANARTNDGYLGYNLAGTDAAGGIQPTINPYGGVILFDGNGQLTSKIYGFRCETLSNTGTVATAMGTALGLTVAPFVDVVPGNPNPTPNLLPIRSQFGFVMYEIDPFTTAGFVDLSTGAVAADPKMTGGTPVYGSATGAVTDEFHEEQWIDQNATPFLINRFNGTLVKGQ
jgi:type II secretory pathway pseudopilin PulG